jgi:hypothetical protein
MGFDGHVELRGVEDIMMTSYEVKIPVQLFIVEAVIAAEPKMEADDVVVVVAGAEAGEGIKPGDGMAHPDAIDLPEEGFAGAGFGCEHLSILHIIKIWRS